MTLDLTFISFSSCHHFSFFFIFPVCPKHSTRWPARPQEQHPWIYCFPQVQEKSMISCVLKASVRLQSINLKDYAHIYSNASNTEFLLVKTKLS